ncbi:MAG: lytic transglycosylase, partial [Armatimonadota bacterium]
FVRRANPRLSPREAETIARSVIGFSLKYGVDARLIIAIVMVESDFNPNCVSSAGAMGLGQLMPCNVQELGIRRPHDLVENIWGTVKLVRGHLDKYKAGSSEQGLILALAAYNAGDGAVKRAGGVPPYRETQRYVVKVTTLYRRLCGL